MRITRRRALAIGMAVCMTGVSVFGVSGIGTLESQAEGKTVAKESVVKAAEESTDTTPEENPEENPIEIEFAQKGGVFENEFNLQLTCEDAGATIYYTMDGSDPSDPANEARIQYTTDGVPITDRKDDPNVLSAIDPVLFDSANVSWNNKEKKFESTLELPGQEDVDKCTVVKAVAQLSDGTYTEVETNTYFVGAMTEHIEGIEASCEAAGMNLAVMSISMDADDLFDSTKGIYVKGDIFNNALEEHLAGGGTIWNAVDFSRGLEANYNQKGKDWERKTHIDYFESNGSETTLQYKQDCGIRVQGNYSRSDYQKGFRLYARDEYGKKNFKYGFWNNAIDDNGNLIEKFKTIVLRNGGNAAFTTKFSDAYWQSLMKDIKCDTLHARPCVVYINGEYWGVYILQDDYRGSYMENEHGVNKDDVLIYKGDAEAIKNLGYKLDEGELPEGVTDESYYFQDLENFLATHDNVANEEDYQELCQIVDPESAIDYFAIQTWINNKWDWPGKNWSMWKTKTVDETNPYADGRWRFMIYDVEFGGNQGSNEAKDNTIKNSKLLTIGSNEPEDDNWDKPNVRVFAMLMTNKGFRDAYIQRLEGLSTTMFEKENAIAVCNQYRNIYEPILDQFFNRFPVGGATAESVMDSGYLSHQTIVNFLNKRADNIYRMVDYVRDTYGDPEPEPTQTPVATQSPEPTQSPVPSIVPTEVPSLAPVATPPAENKVTPGDVSVTLDDGAVKTVTIDENGAVIATRYTIDGVEYALNKDNTLTVSATNNANWKNTKQITISDTEIAGGNPYKITAIEDGAFKGLKKLTKVVIGSNVKTIGKNAFLNCKKLKSIEIESTKLKKVGKNAWKGIHKKAVFRCPAKKVKAYKKLMSAKTGFAKKTMKIKKN